MQLKTYILLLSIAVLLFQNTSSQSYHTIEADTGKADTTYFVRFSEDQILSDSLQMEEPIVFSNFQRYLPQSNLFPYFMVSNVGHSIYSPVFELTKPVNYVQATSLGVYPYLFKRENADYYRNRPPYTSLFYMFGAKEEEMLDVVHTRNFGRNLNVSLHLLRQGSTGFYNNVATRSANFDVDLNYSSVNKRYTLITSYQYNKKTLGENGGYDDFENVTNPETVGSSRLSTAQNTIRDEGLFIGQTLGIGNTNGPEKKYIKPIFRLGYDFQYTRSHRSYIDDGEGISGQLNTDYYQNIYFDSLFTIDSINHSLFSNQANLYLYPAKFKLKLHGRQELIDYRQGAYIDTLYENYFIGGRLDLLNNRNFYLNLDADWAIDGFREGDINSHVNFGTIDNDSGKSVKLNGQFGYELINPTFNELYYVSNNFIWFNRYAKQSNFYFKFSAHKRGYSLSLHGGTIGNMIYYNNDAMASQHSPSIQYLSVGFHKLLEWNHFFLDNRIQYQYFSNRDIIPLPELMIWESVYYQNYLIKKILRFQLGFDVLYYTKHYGYNYMAALNQFHTQNDQQIGAYPYIDLFLNFHLKRAFFFFKIEHLSKGMFGVNYFQVPGHPMPGRAFKMGIKWALFN